MPLALETCAYELDVGNSRRAGGWFVPLPPSRRDNATAALRVSPQLDLVGDEGLEPPASSV